MKAVMWTDVVQICFMFAGIVAVIIKGSVDHGGFSEIWSIMYDDDRIQFWEYVDHCVYTRIIIVIIIVIVVITIISIDINITVVF